MKKKKIFKTFIFVILMLSFCFASFGCSIITLKTKIKNSLSEIRQNFFVGHANRCFITFTSGQREKDYKMDGIKTKLLDFGVLVLKFDYNFGNDLPQFELAVNEDVYAGEAERNPYDNTYVFDIERQITDDMTLRLYLIDFDEYVNLECLSASWKIDWHKALDIFSENFKSDLLKCADKDCLKGEIYIKIVTDSKKLEDIFWYVLLVCKNGDIQACLIDVSSGELIQK